MSGSGFDVTEADATTAATLAGQLLAREDRTAQVEQAACWILAQIGTMFRPVPTYASDPPSDSETDFYYETDDADTADRGGRPGSARPGSAKRAEKRVGAFSGSRTPMAVSAAVVKCDSLSAAVTTAMRPTPALLSE